MSLKVRRLFRERLLRGISGGAWGGESSEARCSTDLFMLAKTTDTASDRNHFFRHTSRHVLHAF